MTRKAKEAAEAVEVEEKSLRDTLSEAFDEEENHEPETVEAATDETEVEEKGEAEEDDKESVSKPDADRSDDSSEPSTRTSDKGESDLGKKPPIDWPPKAREQWLKLPQDVREQINKRERDIAIAMQGSSQAKKTHEALTDLARQYKPIMDAEGVSDPLRAVSGLFQTVAQLRVGSPQQKAERMAKLIQHYGIDIQALDSALAGEPMASPEEQKFASMLDQRMAPVNQLLQQLQQRQYQASQQSQQEAEKAVASFKGEFLSDVRMDMADLIDMAASRGQNMTLQEAYDKAILLRPDIQNILNERKQQEELLGTQRTLENKRNAASSIAGKQTGVPTSGGGSLRDELEAAWGEVDRI